MLRNAFLCGCLLCGVHYACAVDDENSAQLSRALSAHSLCPTDRENVRESVRGVQSFANDITHFYCSSGWICKAFSQMSVPVFSLCWQQVASLIGSPEQRWFYAHENDLTYVQRLNTHYRTYEDFMRGSIEVEWLKQCAEYHAFIEKHLINDNQIIDLDPELEKSPDFDRSLEVGVSEVVWGMAGEATAAFYAFYFECLINVIYKKLAFVDSEKDSAWVYLASVLQDKQTLKNIYTICVHKIKQLTPEQSRAFAYNYRRVDEVLATVLCDMVRPLKDSD